MHGFQQKPVVARWLNIQASKVEHAKGAADQQRKRRQ
jgi:hypothetical protein